MQGKGRAPLFPEPRKNQKAPASRVNIQKQITKYLKASPAVPPATPTPPSTSQPVPPSPPHEAPPSPTPAAQTPPEIIPVSSERGGGSSSAARRATPEGPSDKATEEEKQVNSRDLAEAPANDAVTFPKNFGDPTNLWSTPKAYSHKFFHKLTEAEKWDLEQDLLNSMMDNAWGKEDVESSEIQLHKKEMGDFFDQLLVKRKLESLRSAYQNLETELAEANKKRERAEKQLKDKNSELLQKEADFVQKRQVDSDTMQKLQKEVNGLRNYMTMAEKGWDLLNSDVMADELLEAEYAKEREEEARPVGSGDEGQVTWTSSKDKSKDGATSPTKGAEDDDDDDDEDAVSSPAKETEGEIAQTEDGAGSSPTEEK
nr:uncharacterized protein LOC127346784 [Lolium perenne]